MKRQAHVEYADAPPRVQAIYDEIKNLTGAPDVPNVFKALGTNENSLFAAWTKLRFTVLTGDVPMLLKQLILFNISARARNEYCTALHGNLAFVRRTPHLAIRSQQEARPQPRFLPQAPLL